VYSLTESKGVLKAVDSDNKKRFKQAFRRLTAPKGFDLSSELGFGAGYGVVDIPEKRIKEQLLKLVKQFIILQPRVAKANQSMTGGMELATPSEYKSLAAVVARYVAWCEKKQVLFCFGCASVCASLFLLYTLAG
jgi:hypothetical protein